MPNHEPIKSTLAGVATALLAASALDRTAIGVAAAVWAEATTAADSPRRHDLRRDKARMVTAFFAFCEQPVPGVTVQEVEAWRRALERRQLAAETVYAYLSRLSSFYRWLQRDQQFAQALPHNPVILARPAAPKPYQSRRTSALSDAELRRLLHVVRAAADTGSIAAKRDYALLLLYVLSGMRRREVMQLRWGDLILGPPLIVTTASSGGAARTKAIADPAVQSALLAYLIASDRLDSLTPASPLWIAHDTGRITPPGASRSSEGTPKVVRHAGDALTSHGFVKNLKRYAAAAGLPDFHLHQTRHTFARMVDEDTGSLREVQEALGLTGLASTRRYLERVRTQCDTHSSRIAERLGLASRGDA